MLLDVSIVFGSSNASQSTGFDIYKILQIAAPFVAAFITAIPVVRWKRRLESELKLKRKEANIQIAIPTYEEINRLCYSLNSHISMLFVLFSLDKMESIFESFDDKINKAFEGIDEDSDKLENLIESSQRPHINKFLLRKVEAVLSLIYDSFYKYKLVKDKPISDKIEYANSIKASLDQCTELLSDIEEGIRTELGND